jgi:hypothetical protein
MVDWFFFFLGAALVAQGIAQAGLRGASGNPSTYAMITLALLFLPSALGLSPGSGVGMAIRVAQAVALLCGIALFIRAARMPSSGAA